MKIKRYDFQTERGSPEYQRESKTGEYVRYLDHLKHMAMAVNAAILDAHIRHSKVARDSYKPEGE